MDYYHGAINCARALRRAEVDTVVLGCTHYPFVADALSARLPAGTRLVDTAQAIARRTAQLLGPSTGAAGSEPGRTELWSTGDPAPLERLARQGLGPSLRAARLAL